MTANELIAALSALPPETTVEMESSKDDGLGIGIATIAPGTTGEDQRPYAMLMHD